MSTGEYSFRDKYSFTEVEFNTLKKILSDLYGEISFAVLPEKTKTKLFEHLNILNSYTGRDYSNLDIFWSFIGRSEIAFRVYNQNKIPDKLKELLSLIWKVQCRTEGKSPDSSPPIRI